MRAIPLALALLLALPLAPAEGGALVQPYTVEVDGQTAQGLLATPVGAPLGIVVILHGYGHKAESHRAHLEALAAEGFVALAMDYRGEGFPLRAGADDTIAAAQDVFARFPNLPHHLYSVSMGTAVAGIVLAELPAFDTWTNNEGLSDLVEIWAGATVLAGANEYARNAVRDIETECGGTPVQAPVCYQERSAATRAVEFPRACLTAASETCRVLRGVVLTHGANDGLVPYDQGRKMQGTLAAAGVPTEFYTVVGCEAPNGGTTLTGYSPLGPMGLAGHGSEDKDVHCLTGLSFSLLHDVIHGRLALDGGEHVVDAGQTTTLA